MTDLLAGLAANSIGAFVKGFTPLRASVAGLFTTRHLDEARNDELAGFIQFVIAYRRHLLDDGLYVSFGKLRSLRNCLNQFQFSVILAMMASFVEVQNSLKRMSFPGSALCLKRGKAMQFASRSCLW